MPNSSWSLLFDCDHLCKWAISSYMASFTDSVIFIGVFYASKWQYFFCLRLAVCSRWTHRYFVDSAYHKSIDTKYICCAFIFMISAFSFFFFFLLQFSSKHCTMHTFTLLQRSIFVAMMIHTIWIVSHCSIGSNTFWLLLVGDFMCCVASGWMWFYSLSTAQSFVTSQWMFM